MAARKRKAAEPKAGKQVKHHPPLRAAGRLAVAALAVTALSFAARAEPPRCNAQLERVRFVNPLTRVARRLAANQPITIVAIGSSSTAGAGASSPAASYPSRLEVELSRHFPGHALRVVNRGVGGEVIADMLKRFDEAVVAAKPDLVIWQIGTNSVIRDRKVMDHAAAIQEGIKKIRAAGADAILIDPQYAPKVIAKAEARQMVALIALAAKQANVDLYPRFEVMRRWRDDDHLDFATFVSPDGLHMNDWSYACLATSLAQAIAEAARRPVLSASAQAFAD
jgi:acyl-CoA thioesterase-1